MSEAKTQPNTASVEDFLAAIEHPVRRADAEALAKLFKKASGWRPRMWGPNIVGFGRYDYTYESGHSGKAPVVGFSPRKASFSLYLAQDLPGRGDFLARLGKHKAAVGCVYVNKLADVDAGVLQDMIAASVAHTKSRWPVSPN
jgi:hypothetical protein